MPKHGGRPMGSSLRSIRWTDSPRFLLHCGWSYRAFAWIYKEIPKDASQRARHRTATDERGDVMSDNPHIGSSLDDFLTEEDIYEEVNTIAIKRVLVWQIEQLMKEQKLSKTAMAQRMRTSRSALDRLLDPKSEAVTLHTLQRAAQSLGKQIRLELVG